MQIDLDILKDSDLKDILAECYRSTEFMASLLFHDEFSSGITELEHKAFDFLDNCKAKKKCIVGTRGLGKTTIGGIYARKRILFQDRHFLGYLTNSSDISEMITNSWKDKLTSHRFTRKVFGDVRTSRVEGIEEKWAQKSWIANGYSFILPRGVGQQVNGLIWNGWRPDFWFVDDFDDRIEVNNEVQRKKRREWFFSVLMYTFSQYKNSNDWEITVMDSMKHDDCLVSHLMEDPEWETLVLPICDDNYKTLCPEMASQEDLNAEIEGHRLRGTMDLFARERMCIASSKESGSFNAKMFTYYDENETHFVKEVRPRLFNILLWDPARTKNPRSAQTAFVVWGFDFEYNMFYVRLALGEHYTWSEQYEKAIQLSQDYQVQGLGIEMTGLEEHIEYPFKNECMRRKLAWLASRVFELKPRAGRGSELSGLDGGKEGRIRGLLPFYEKGLIKHNKLTCGPLETQLLGSRLRDVADCAAYLPQAVMQRNLFMSPPGFTYNQDAFNEQIKKLGTLKPMQRKVFA
jgi:hypothetical protein